MSFVVMVVFRESAWGLSNPPHIVVGNPRSLQPLVDGGQLQLGSVAFVVLDEVDTCLLNKQASKVRLTAVHYIILRYLPTIGLAYTAYKASIQHLQ